MSKKLVRVLETEQYDEGFPPEGINEFKLWLDSHIKKIPLDCIDRARIQIEVNHSYGESYAKVEISYLRNESEEEVAEKKKADAQRLQNQIEQATQRLNALKAKKDAEHG